MTDKYPRPRDIEISIGLRELDEMLQLPEGLRIEHVRADAHEPHIIVRLTGDALPERAFGHPVTTFGYTVSTLDPCGHRRYEYPFLDREDQR